MLLDSLFILIIINATWSARAYPPDTTESVKAELFLQLCSRPLPEGHANTEWELRLFERKLVAIWISTELWRRQALENPTPHPGPREAKNIFVSLWTAVNKQQILLQLPLTFTHFRPPLQPRGKHYNQSWKGTVLVNNTLKYSQFSQLEMCLLVAPADAAIETDAHLPMKTERDGMTL